MRSRRSANEQVAEVARRRLELLSAELAVIRPDLVEPPSKPGTDGSGESPDVASPATRPGRHARRSVDAGTVVLGWIHDRLPPTLQGRVQMGASHLSVVAVLVAVALGVTAWWTVRASDPGDLVPARSPVEQDVPSLLVSPNTAVSPGPSPATASGTGAEAGLGAVGVPTPEMGVGTGEIVVDVAGKVRRPGIARLPFGSRVVDALEAAGGTRRGVNLGSLNLARVLVDGEQVLVGVATVPGVAASAAAAPAPPGTEPPAPLVSLNTADQAALETLPGVGPVTAQSILQWRAEHGSFTAVEELLDIPGIGEATLAELAPFVTL